VPIIRVSPKLWKEISEVSGELGVSLSYGLDKIIDDLRMRVKELEGERKTNSKPAKSRTKQPQKWVAGIEGLVEG